MKDEIEYYGDGEVRVTNSRVIIRSKTYAMANITSVSTSTIRGSHLLELLLAMGGFSVSACSGLMFFGAALTEEWGTVVSSGLGVLLGFGIIALGIYSMRKNKDSYVIRLSAASGEVDAFQSRDWPRTSEIVEAINKAIVGRG